jgi:hypothetical protein
LHTISREENDQVPHYVWDQQCPGARPQLPRVKLRIQLPVSSKQVTGKDKKQWSAEASEDVAEQSDRKAMQRIESELRLATGKDHLRISGVVQNNSYGKRQP